MNMVQNLRFVVLVSSTDCVAVVCVLSLIATLAKSWFYDVCIVGNLFSWPLVAQYCQHWH